MTTRCRQTCSSASNRSCRESPSWNCHWCPQFCTTWTRLFRSRSLRRRRDYASRHNGNGTVLSPGNGPLSRSCRRSTSSWNQRKRGKSQSHCSPASTCASTSTLRLKEENGSVPMALHSEYTLGGLLPLFRFLLDVAMWNSNTEITTAFQVIKRNRIYKNLPSFAAIQKEPFRPVSFLTRGELHSQSRNGAGNKGSDSAEGRGRAG